MVDASHPKKNTDDAFQKSEKQPANEIEKVDVTKEIAEAIKRRGALRSERLRQITDSFFIHVDKCKFDILSPFHALSYLYRMAFILIGGSNCVVINLSLYKIQLENGELYKSSKGGRVQHYKSQEKAEAKIKKLGDIALNAIVVESKARTAAVKTVNPEEIVPETKVEKISKKKSAAKAEKTDETATDAKVEGGKKKKAKKPKKAPSND